MIVRNWGSKNATFCEIFKFHKTAHLLQKSRQTFVYWFNIDSCSSDVHKHRCNRDRIVKFSFNDGMLWEKHSMVRPWIINYRSFEHFPNETSRISLESNLPKVYFNNHGELEKFYKATMDTLNKIAPIKKKHFPDSQMPFMIQKLSKEIIARSKLGNNYLINKTDKKCFFYTAKRNKCAALLRNTTMRI